MYFSVYSLCIDTVRHNIVYLLDSLNCYNDLKVNCLYCCCIVKFKSLLFSKKVFAVFFLNVFSHCLSREGSRPYLSVVTSWLPLKSPVAFLHRGNKRKPNLQTRKPSNPITEVLGKFIKRKCSVFLAAGTRRVGCSESAGRWDWCGWVLRSPAETDLVLPSASQVRAASAVWLHTGICTDDFLWTVRLFSMLWFGFLLTTSVRPLGVCTFFGSHVQNYWSM